MMFNLSGKTAIITGASRGIGEATAKLFAENGADLILLSRDTDRLNILKKSLISKFGSEVDYFGMDIMDEVSIKEAFREIRALKKNIEILVNNAGIMEDAVLQMVKPDLIDRIYQTNVFGLFRVSQQAIKLMIRNRKGSIINLTSIIGTNGNKGQTIYGSSKAAVIGFTKSLSKEMASLGIRVNAIAPGFINTDMTAGMDPEFYQKNIESIGMGRIGQPEDVAKVNLFLASDLSEYVTGQIIGVDGGMII